MRNAASLLTPPTPSAIAVVRLTGPDVAAFLARRFSSPAAVGRAVHGLLVDESGRTLDDPVVVLCDADTADLNLHGGTWVVRSVLDLAERDGFAWADAVPEGETELWREVMAALPVAATPDAARMLLAQPAAWAAAAERADPAELRAILDDPSGRWLTSPPTVAIVGPANVGKSTLTNRLFGQERSITADVPGTTRDWVGGVADLGGLAVVLIDTPGVRVTDDPIELTALLAAGRRVATADLTIVVLDRSAPITDDGRAVLAAHPDAVHVANKADAAAAWDDAGMIRTVATTGLGIDAVRAAVRQRFGCEAVDPHRPRWWTDRQREILGRALDDPAGLRSL
jgi:tRNA modification GTPase